MIEYQDGQLSHRYTPHAPLPSDQSADDQLYLSRVTDPTPSRGWKARKIGGVGPSNRFSVFISSLNGVKTFINVVHNISHISLHSCTIFTQKHNPYFLILDDVIFVQVTCNNYIMSTAMFHDTTILVYGGCATSQYNRPAILPKRLERDFLVSQILLTFLWVIYIHQCCANSRTLLINVCGT